MSFISIHNMWHDVPTWHFILLCENIYVIIFRHALIRHCTLRLKSFFFLCIYIYFLKKAQKLVFHFFLLLDYFLLLCRRSSSSHSLVFAFIISDCLEMIMSIRRKRRQKMFFGGSELNKRALNEEKNRVAIKKSDSSTFQYYSTSINLTSELDVLTCIKIYWAIFFPI